ncbi:MAG: aldehyde dehydrogenase family protein, partial [Gammaproteobacteria bacterium]
MTKKYDMTIGNDTVAADEYREILDPATGAVVGLAPVATKADLDAAVATAGAVFATWSQADDETRRAACHAIADVLEANAAELAELVTREQGKPLKGMGSEFEIGGCIGWTRYTAEQQLPVKVLQDDENGRIEQHRIPIGVVGSITPWNWPLLIAIWHIVPAVRTGNTVVIKPSPYTPLGTLRLVEL